MRFVLTRLFFGLLYAGPIILLTLAACGGGGGGGGTTVSVSTPAFVLGGTTSGLTSSGLVLQNNGGDDLIVAQNATQFTFGDAVDAGANYDVTVKTQPTLPVHQLCSVSNSAATMPAHDVTDVQVVCVDNTFALGGAIEGLTSDGLVLQYNGANEVAVPAGSTQFIFGNKLNPGANYVISVKSNPNDPSAQTCSINNSSGTMPAQNLAIANLTCVDVPPGSFTLGGTTAGLTSNGLVLQNNGVDDLTVSKNVSQFTFGAAVVAGEAYNVTVKSQPGDPVHQLCSITNPIGTMPTHEVADISVECVDHTFALGGQISGLTGSGLVLQYNGAHDLNVVPAATQFEFVDKLNPGASYVVSVKFNPAQQSCSVSNQTGAMPEQNLANIQVTCVDVPPATYSLGGQISGLTNNGLVLHNGGDDLAVALNATQFSFASRLIAGTTYDVSVTAQPAHQRCTVDPVNSPIMPAHDVTDIQIRCVDYTFSLGGSTSGLTSHGLVLKNNANLEVLPVSETVSGIAAFTFVNKLDPGGNYDVVVNAQPNSPSPQSCSVAGGTDVMPASNVSAIQVDCVDVLVPSHTLGGNTSGLTSDGLVLLNSVNSEELPVLSAVSGVSDFTFVNTVIEGASYTVTVKNNPSIPVPQACSVTRGAGTMQTADVSNLQVDCVNAAAGNLTITVVVLTLNGSGLVLQNSGTYDLSIAPSGQGGNVIASFATQFAAGDSYDLSISSQPLGQTCHYLGQTSGTLSGDLLITMQCLTP